MIGTLKKLSGYNYNQFAKGYNIFKYWHPEAKHKVTFHKHVDTLEEAQAICGAPEGSFKEGPEENWYFLGYAEAKSDTAHLTPWDAVNTD